MNSIKKRFTIVMSTVICAIICLNIFPFYSLAADEYTSGHFTYTLDSGNATITSYTETALGSVTIPSKIDDYTVVAIDGYAFFACTLLVSINVPNTVKSIGTYAFAYCTNLETVDLPDSVNSIGASIFMNSNKVSVICSSGSVAYSYAKSNSIPIIIRKHTSFSMRDGWSFVNGGISFIGDRSEYFIPKNRYEEVFGKSYVELNDIPTSWGGNCFGMSVSAALFNKSELNWSYYDSLYENDFSRVNDYYYELRWDKPSGSFTKYAYSTTGYDTPITQLIEQYQIMQGTALDYYSGDNSTYDDVRADYIDEGVTISSSSTEVIKNYSHIEDGSYISDVLTILRETSVPLCLGLTFQGGGHCIVARTDRKPEYDKDGWFRVYVYDPNTPYIDESLTGSYKLKNYYYNYLQERGEDRYIELNPSKNLFRYQGSINENDGSVHEYRGCDADENVLFRTQESEYESVKYTYSMPEYFFVFNPSAWLTTFNGTEPWTTPDEEKSAYIQIDSESDFCICDLSGKAMAVSRNGQVVTLDSDFIYTDFSGTADGASNPRGRLTFPQGEYDIDVLSGDVNIVNNSNVIDLIPERQCSFTVDSADNSVSLRSKTRMEVECRISNVLSDNEFSSLILKGNVADDDEFTIALNDGIIETDTSVSGGELEVYARTEDQPEKVKISGISDADGIDIREAVVQKIQLNASNIDLTYKSTITLNAAFDGVGSINWSTDNASVVTVDKSGMVTAVGRGVATIKATVEDTDISAECTVTVKYAWWQWLIRIFLFGWLWY